jgi:hypothetical protein
MTSKEAEASEIVRPVIISIDPASVKQNSELPLTVHGSNFNKLSFVVADHGLFLHTTYASDSELKGDLTKEVTGRSGKKSIEVHNTDTGTLSNEVALTVEPTL